MDADARHGLISRQRFLSLIARGRIGADSAIEPAQIQPASLDLRLGAEAFRLRASFLPGRGGKVRERLLSLAPERLSLEGDGAVLEKGIVYLAPLQESLDLCEPMSGAANPKSSTGRLDIFTRLIVDGSEAFDHVPQGYQGGLWVEICPRSFSVRARKGSKLNQLRLRERAPQQADVHNFALADEALRRRHEATPLVDGPLKLREGLIVHVGLAGGRGEIVGYRAIKNGNVIDVDKPGFYPA